MTAAPTHWPASASKARNLLWSWVKPATAGRFEQVIAAHYENIKGAHKVLPFLLLVGRSQHVVVVVEHGPPRLRLHSLQWHLLLDRFVPGKPGAAEKEHASVRQFQVNRHQHVEIVLHVGLRDLYVEDHIT